MPAIWGRRPRPALRAWIAGATGSYLDLGIPAPGPG